MNLLKHPIKLLALAVAILWFSTAAANAQYPAYQQALLNERVGFGASVTGGAGGQEYWVTSHADSGPGTLREAVSGHEPRWILFAVSGDFYLNDRIWVGANKTVDARGANVRIVNYGLMVQFENVILENLYFDRGNIDALEIVDGATNVWVDHCHFNRWADEAIAIIRPVAHRTTDVTISWSKFSGTDKTILIHNINNDPNGINIRVTMHHNWFENANQRCPRLRRGLVHAYNNLLVNWGLYGMSSTDAGQLRTQNNIFHAGSNKTAVKTSDDVDPAGYSSTPGGELANWKLNGATTVSRYPERVFIPEHYYNYTTDKHRETLEANIRARAGATRSTSGFANLSTRANVQNGEGVLVAGLHVSGSGNKRLVIRGIGPSFGGMSNPQLQVYNSSGAEIAYNNDWQQDSQASALAAAGVAPSNAAEAAVLRTLAPGAYTAVVSGVGGETGGGLIELYDLDGPHAAQLVNISSRATVDPNDPPVAGLILTADVRRMRVLLRGLGPSLWSRGVQNPIPYPTLALYDAYGNLIRFNDDWRWDESAGEVEAIGMQPADDRESAMIVELQSGNYTAVIRDYLNIWGIGLVEAYKLN